MASNKYKEYEKILESYNDKNKKQLDKNTKTANNYKARLEAGGVKNVDNAVDNRNALEKFLNLEKDQNVIFDLFELLNRPQQAVFNAWKAEQEGKDAGEAAWKGFSGQEDVQFKDILKNYGMEDREGKIDAADVLGFAGDVFLDPMDLIPVAGFGKFNDALEAGESLGKAAKNLKSGTQVVMSGIGKGLKGTAKLADKGIEKGLTKYDELVGAVDNITGDVVKFKYDDTAVKNAADLVKKAVDTGEDISNRVVGKLENYKQIKNDISRMFQVSDRYKKAILTKRGQEVNSELARLQNAILTDDAMDKVQKYADKYGEEISNIGKEATLFKEMSIDRVITNEKLLKLAKEGKLEAYDEVVDALNNMIERDVPANLREMYDVSVNINDNGKIILGKDLLNGKVDLKPAREHQLLNWQQQLKNAITNNDTDTTQEITNLINNNITNFGYHYTPEQMKELKKVVNKYVKNADYRELLDDILGTAWKGEEPINLTGELSDVEKLLNKARKAGDTVNIKPGLIENLNANIDQFLGSDLTNKYDEFTNVGYVPHVIPLEQQKLVNQYNNLIKNNPSIGSTKLLSERTKLGSVAEVNSRFRDTVEAIDDELLKKYPDLLKFKQDKSARFMEENFFNAVTNRYIEPKGINKLVTDANLSNKVLAKKVFGDFDEMLDIQNKINTANNLGKTDEAISLTRELNKIGNDNGIKLISSNDTLVPKGYKKMEKSKLISDLKKYQIMNSQVGIDSGLGDIIKQLEKYEGTVAIDEDFVDMFKLASKRDNYTGLSGLYNSYMNLFKKWKTASPTFLLNNVAGNSTNLMLSGISYGDQAKYSQTVMDILQNGQKYYLDGIMGKTLNPNQQKIATLWHTYRTMGFDQSALALQELPEEFTELFKSGKKLKNAKDVVTNGIPYVNNYLNIQMDNAARLTVMLKCLDDPSYIQRLNVNNVQEAISRVMFDPDMLTSFERNKIKKIIPFYTYAKNNMMYHVMNMGQNGKKYNQLMKSMKGLRNLATNDNEENMSDFIKNNLYIPLPGVDKNGNYTVLRASLPFGQLLDTVNDPLGGAIGLLTPAVKSPIEFATNKDSFTGNDIESFPGELSKDIPFLTKKQAKILGDFTGLDVPIKNVGRIATGIGEGISSGQDILSSIGKGLRNTVAMDNNVNTDKLYKSYQEITDLQNLMKKYQQKGYTFATITELKQANKNNTIEGIDAIFDKYGIK